MEASTFWLCLRRLIPKEAWLLVFFALVLTADFMRVSVTCVDAVLQREQAGPGPRSPGGRGRRAGPGRGRDVGPGQRPAGQCSSLVGTGCKFPANY
jgi:hypothetical protein